MAAVAAHGAAVARARVDLGQRRHDGDHLPRRADRRQPRAVRGGLGRRRVALAQGLAHHDAAAARRAAADDDPADHRDGAGVPRAVPVHLGRAGQLDAHRAAADLRLRVRQLPGRRLRRGDRAEPDARRLPGRCSRSSTCAPRAPGARRDRLRRRRRAPTARRAASSRPDWRRPRRRCGFGGRAGAAAHRAGRGRARPAPLAAKAAVTPTKDTITHPMALFPHGAAWGNLREAWTDVDVGRYFGNTVVARDRLVGLADHRRDHRRLRAVRAAAEVREGRSPASSSRRCSCRPWCCSCRSTSRSCTRR